MATKKQNGEGVRDAAPTEETTEPQAPTMEQEAPGLDLKDLAVAIQLIEAAIQRGVYQPRELTVVGETHGRIQAFLEHQAKLQAAAQQAAQAAETQGDA